MEHPFFVVGFFFFLGEGSFCVFFSLFCLFLPKQPFMAPNLVPLEQSFNHQTNFSLSLFLCSL